MPNRLASLVALAFSAVPFAAAYAEDQACRWAEWGPGYFKVLEKGEVWTYVLDVAGPRWRHTPYGRHGPGHLSCESCRTDPPEPGGLYHFAAQADLNKSPSAYPVTATERAERRTEFVGYPYVPFHPNNLEHVGSREDVTLGPLSGYAVLYRLVPGKGGEPRTLADRLGIRREDDRGLLVISLADGCVRFEVEFFLIGVGDGRGAWAALDALTKEATMRRVPGSAIAPAPRRRPGEPNLYGAIVRNPEASTSK